MITLRIVRFWGIGAQKCDLSGNVRILQIQVNILIPDEHKIAPAGIGMKRNGPAPPYPGHPPHPSPPSARASLQLVDVAPPGGGGAEPGEKGQKSRKCARCGMFSAKLNILQDSVEFCEIHQKARNLWKSSFSDSFLALARVLQLWF